MKTWIFAILFGSLTLISSRAFAGPYLNTAAMLLQENTLAAKWVRSNMGDKELAKYAHQMAQARVDVASKMNVPAEVNQAHPHLLLALAAMERATQAAAEGQVSTFITQLQASSGEAKTFQAVLKTKGFSLPSNKTAALVEPKRSVQPVAAATPPTRWCYVNAIHAATGKERNELFRFAVHEECVRVFLQALNLLR